MGPDDIRCEVRPVIQRIDEWSINSSRCGSSDKGHLSDFFPTVYKEYGHDGIGIGAGPAPGGSKSGTQ